VKDVGVKKRGKMSKYVIGDWRQYEGAIFANITNSKTLATTMMTMSTRDVVKNTPIQLLNLVSKMIENAIDTVK